MARKKVVVATLTIVLFFLVSLVSTINAGEKKYVWKCGNPAPKEHSSSKAQFKFAEMLNKRTNGQVKVTVHCVSSLGPMFDQFENVVRGTQEMGFLPPSPHFNKALQAVYMPYIVSTWKEGEKVFGADGWMTKLLKPIYADIGIELLGFCFVGMDGYGNTKGPVIKPSDIKNHGIKTRVWCTADRLLFQPLGGTISMPFSDLYTALQTGVCHAQDNAPPNTYQSLRDVTKYYSTINWMFEAFSVIMNKELYDSLKPDLQKTVQSCMREALSEFNEVAKNEDEIYLKKMEEYGIKVDRLTSEQLIPWVKHGRSIWPKMAEECGADIVKQVTAHTK